MCIRDRYFSLSVSISTRPSVPVSYTHLDVYKRQANSLLHVGSGVKVALTTAHPVSYTHLDVYKRQPPHDVNGYNSFNLGHAGRVAGRNRDETYFVFKNSSTVMSACFRIALKVPSGISPA